MKPVTFFNIFLLCLLLFFSCGKKTTVVTIIPTKGQEILKKESKDTISYILSFENANERLKFSSSLESMIKNYNFKKDTVDKNKYLHILITSEKKEEPEYSFFEKEEEILSKEYKKEPTFGGSCKIFSPREFIDENLLTFISCIPFKEKCNTDYEEDAVEFLEIKNISNVEIIFYISDKAINSRGSKVSSVDIVNALNTYIKQHPAEGFSLFRNVRGILDFIKGKEAIVTGFVLKDERTFSIKLEQPDSFAIKRLCNLRFLPYSLNLGKYFIKNFSGNIYSILPNPNFPNKKAYLSSCNFILGKDNNPFLSFSVGKYDVAILFFIKDLDYIRSKNLTQIKLLPFKQDRYFLSCIVEPFELRQAIRKSINPKEILENFLKTEGNVINSLESDAFDFLDNMRGKQNISFVQSEPISVVYCLNDPASCIIAEKIVADLSRSKIQAILAAKSITDYELCMINKDYGIAVGWVSDKISFSESEKLRLGSIWFNDEPNEKARILQLKEIPLFTVKNYLLCKNQINFAGKDLSQIFVEKE